MSQSRDLATRRGSVPVSKGDNPVRSLQSDVNRLFNDFFGDFSLPALHHLPAALATPTPAIDVAETEAGYLVTAELPGIDAQDVQITVSDGYVTLKGDKVHHSTTEHKGFFRQERSFGRFQRVFALPHDADLDQTRAEMKDGVLTLTIARVPEGLGNQRRINIREVA